MEEAPQTTIQSNSHSVLGRTPKQWVFVILGINVIIFSIFLLTGGYYLIKNSFFSKTSGGGEIISGKIDLNGHIPDSATIIVSTREHGTTTFSNAVTGISATDGAAYSWDGATKGTLYDLQATLIVNNQNITQSNIYTIAAPAHEEILTINSTASPASQGLSTISGSIDLNGSIPSGATVTVLAKGPNDSIFRPVIGGFAAIDGTTWIWNSAETGASYQLQANLISGSQTVGTSNILTVSAPANNEVLTINSTVTPPAPQTTTVSGTINFNGTVPGGSTISVAYRVTGQTNFSMFAQNLPATSGSAWSFSEAKSGTSYDFQAYMITNGTPSAASQILTASAPASNETLTLNVQNQPSGPIASNMTTNCQSTNSSGVWQVQFNFNNGPEVTNAKQYWLTVGTNSGGSQQISNTYTPSNPEQPQSYTSGYIFNQNQTYYAQWAYATCTNCSTFTSFSPSIQFSCGAPVPTPTNTPVPTPTNTPVPTDTPIPTPTPTTVLPTNIITTPTP